MRGRRQVAVSLTFVVTKSERCEQASEVQAVFLESVLVEPFGAGDQAAYIEGPVLSWRCFDAELRIEGFYGFNRRLQKSLLHWNFPLDVESWL